MANTFNFRSAFNGFNREDVVHYIEYINSNHNNQMNQLKADLAAARQEKVAAWSNSQNDEQVQELKDRCAELESKSAELESKAAELERKAAELEARLAAVTAERDEAIKAAESARQTAEKAASQAVRPAPVIKMSSYVEDELACYRRAERVERETRERAAALEQDTREKAERMEREANEYSERVQREADEYAGRVRKDANEHANAIYSRIQGILSDAIIKADEAASQLGGMSNQIYTHLDNLQQAVSGSQQALHEAAASLEINE